MRERATKSTFFLADSRRAQLKSIGAEHKKTVTELLAEGADLVIEKYRGLGERDELERRAGQARARMREGVYEGPNLSETVDARLYPTRRKKR